MERFFRDLTVKQIRRGSFTSVKSLVETIYAYIDNLNSNPTPFVWTAEAEKIIEKIGRARIVLDKSGSN